MDPLLDLAAHRGHFVLESGHHSSVWFPLEALFVSPSTISPFVAALAERVAPHSPTAICGPLLGGAFLAQSVATTLGAEFYFTERAEASETGLFGARYTLPRELERRLRLGHHRVAIVDDAISAGSSVRATHLAVTHTGASVAVIGALVVFGTEAVDHYRERDIPVEAVAHRKLELWTPEECPLCARGVAVEKRQG